MRFSPLLLAALLAGCAVVPSPEPAPVQAADPLHIETYGAPAKVHTLVIVIHDDGEPGARSDEDAFAKAAVGIIPEAMAVTILRPGYSNKRGNTSPGDHGQANGDNFTLDRVAALGVRIQQITKAYPRANIILVGDGGGAALVANLAGLHPDIADAIMLVGCPCALPEWRTHMAARTGDPVWKAAVTSLDPLKFAGGVSTGLQVVVLVGGEDAITPVRLSRAYVEALTLRGIATDYRIVPGAGHNLLQDPDAAMAALTHLAARLPEKP